MKIVLDVTSVCLYFNIALLPQFTETPDTISFDFGRVNYEGMNEFLQTFFNLLMKLYTI